MGICWEAPRAEPASSDKCLRGISRVAIISKVKSDVCRLRVRRADVSIRIDGVRMRAIRRAIALLILSPIFLLAISESSVGVQLLAQVTGQPGPAPLTPPAAPGQPASFSTIGALPALAPAPGTFRASALQAAAQPTPRAFRCTCSAPGYYTQWAGEVVAPSYILAKQAATGQCVNFNVNSNAPSPYIPPPTQFARPGLQNGTAFNNSHTIINSNVAAGQPVSVFKGTVAGECTQCACN